MTDVEKYAPEFDYSVWTANTTLQMCSVPWDASYRDLVRFDTAAEKEAWFANQLAKGTSTGVLTGVHYLKYGEPVMVPLPFSQCNKCNYLVVKNPMQPVPSRVSTPSRTPDTFYYFVQDCEYVAPNTTALHVQLDVWQTYYERVSFGLSFIEQGHIGVANENCTTSTMSTYLLEPEGLQIGSAYDVVNQEFYGLVDGLGEEQTYVYIMTNTSFKYSFGTVSKPNLKTAEGTESNGILSGAECYACPASQFSALMDALKDAPWVAQGIQYMALVPVDALNLSDKVLKVGDAELRILRSRAAHGFAKYIVPDFLDNFNIPENYQDYIKLYTYPYCVLELTANQGSTMFYEPQNFAGDKDAITFTYKASVTPPNNRMVLWPDNYNGTKGFKATNAHDGCGNEFDVSVSGGDNLDSAFVYGDFPLVSIVNNMYAYQLAATTNTRSFAMDNADWTYTKAARGAGVAAENAETNMANAREQQRMQNELAWAGTTRALAQNSDAGAMGTAQAVAGGINSAMSLNPAGVIGSLVDIGVTNYQTSQNAQWISQATSQQTTAANNMLATAQGYQQQVIDNNFQYAYKAAQGDYQQNIKAIMAQTQDMRLTQPSTVGNLGGDQFNWANGIAGFVFKWKRLKPQYMTQVAHYFMRYGYSINRWITPSTLHCMSKFTYWRMQECVLFAQIPEVFKQAIRGIFESGCTVWHNPDDVGRTPFKENKKLAGVKY